MGRHTKTDDEGPTSDGHAHHTRWFRWIGRVPLLPVVAGAGAVGMVAAAIGTSQVSLNFTDSTPRAPDYNVRTAPAEAGGARSPEPGDGRGSGQGSQHAAQNTPSESRHGDVRARRDDTHTSRGAERSGVTVVFHTVSRWATGFQGTVKISNHSGRAIRGWTLSFRYPHAKILSAWDVAVVRRGSTLVVRNPAHRSVIPAGRTAEVSFTAQGNDGTPSACEFNGKACG